MMWGGVVPDELKRQRRIKLKSKRDVLFDQIKEYKAEYQKSKSERQIIEEQIRKGNEERERITEELGREGQRDSEFAYDYFSPESERLAEEHEENEQNLQRLGKEYEEAKERESGAETKLRGTQQQAHKTEESINKINTRQHSAKSIFETPTKVANRISGGSAGLLFGLIAVVIVLWFAVTPATKANKKSRLILAQEALAGQVSIKGGI